jgi:hypothetical protein
MSTPAISSGLFKAFAVGLVVFMALKTLHPIDDGTGEQGECQADQKPGDFSAHVRAVRTAAGETESDNSSGWTAWEKSWACFFISRLLKVGFWQCSTGRQRAV